MFRFHRFFNFQAFSSRGIRNAAYRQERIVTNEDGSIIVCWHPEPKFPYELTQPVPRNVPTAQTLKVQAVEDMKELYHHKPERIARRDLMRLTWTSKHKWFRTSRAQKLYNPNKAITRERPYL